MQFTSVELYQAYADYNDMMDLTESMLRACAQAVCGTLQVGVGHDVYASLIDIQPVHVSAAEPLPSLLSRC
jgi:lysyl-tRNA synthetase class II